jgi:hypothetical protein
MGGDQISQLTEAGFPAGDTERTEAENASFKKDCCLIDVISITKLCGIKRNNNTYGPVIHQKIAKPLHLKH